MSDQRLDRLLQATAMRGMTAGPMPSRLLDAVRSRRRATMWTRVAVVGSVAASAALAVTALHLSGRHGRPSPPIDFVAGSSAVDSAVADRGDWSPAAAEGEQPTLGYYRRAIGPGGAGMDTAVDRAATRAVESVAKPVRARDVDAWLQR